jgi:hypothetical protein
MLILLMIIAAPIAQIILSILRVKGRIGLPIGAIMVLSFILGIVLTFAALNTVDPPSPLSRPRCDFATGVILFGGIFLQMITVPVIAIISYGIYRLKGRNDKKLNMNSGLSF